MDEKIIEAAERAQQAELTTSLNHHKHRYRFAPRTDGLCMDCYLDIEPERITMNYARCAMCQAEYEGSFA